MQRGKMQKSKKILLVEDSRLTAVVVGDFLQKNGFETETAVFTSFISRHLSVFNLPEKTRLRVEQWS